MSKIRNAKEAIEEIDRISSISRLCHEYQLKEDEIMANYQDQINDPKAETIKVSPEHYDEIISLVELHELAREDLGIVNPNTYPAGRTHLVYPCSGRLKPIAK